MTSTQRVVALLRSRGIETTPQEVDQWAKETNDQYLQQKLKNGFQSSTEDWLLGVINNQMIPTICLHAYFGDEI